MNLKDNKTNFGKLKIRIGAVHAQKERLITPRLLAFENSFQKNKIVEDCFH